MSIMIRMQTDCQSHDEFHGNWFHETTQKVPLGRFARPCNGRNIIYDFYGTPGEITIKQEPNGTVNCLDNENKIIYSSPCPLASTY